MLGRLPILYGGRDRPISPGRAVCSLEGDATMIALLADPKVSAGRPPLIRLGRCATKWAGCPGSLELGGLGVFLAVLKHNQRPC